MFPLDLFISLPPYGGPYEFRTGTMPKTLGSPPQGHPRPLSVSRVRFPSPTAHATEQQLSLLSAAPYHLQSSSGTPSQSAHA